MLIYLIAALAAAFLVAPDSAAADKANCPKKLERTYSANWHKVRKHVSKRAPGRNIRRDGVRFRGVTFVATCGELRRSRHQLKKLLRAPSLMYSTAVAPAQPPAGVKTDFNMASLPSCTWQPESGGNYNAYNPSSGAYGKYQVIPSTWQAHCSDLGRDPAGQEECAARVYAAQGSGAWVNC